MKTTYLRVLPLMLLMIGFLGSAEIASSQIKLLDKIKKKADQTKRKVENAIDNKVDDLLSAPEKELSGKSNEKEKKTGEKSIIKEGSFYQNSSFPEADPGNTRVSLAGNLAIDIQGKYPPGYKPKWRFITYSSNLDFLMENYITPRSAIGHDKRKIEFGNYNGKAVLRFGAFISCDCYAEIIINDKLNVLTEEKQTFKVTNFQKIVNERITGEPCKGMNNMYTDGGWEGVVTLSANRNGDIAMELVIENFRLASRFSEAGVSYRYIAKDIIIENEMSAEKAVATVKAEQEAKQRQKEYIARMTKQGDSLQALIAKKYTQKNCIECFSRSSNSSLRVTPTKTIYSDGYGDLYAESGTDWDINTKTDIQNKCNYDLLFIGIQQLYEEGRGYYLVEVTKRMEKGYRYQSDQGAFATVFTSLVGMGSEFNFQVQDKYYPGGAMVGAVQWLKVIRSE